MSAETVRNHYRKQGAEAERERMIQIIERLNNHGMTHSPRCLPHHLFAERAIKEIKGETDNFDDVSNSRHAEAKELEVIPEKPDSSN